MRLSPLNQVAFLFEKVPGYCVFRHKTKTYSKIRKIFQFITSLLVSGRSPECFDCLLGYMKENKKLKWTRKKNLRNFFLKIENFFENHPSSIRHIEYKVITFARRCISIMAKNLPSTNLERGLRRVKSYAFKARKIYRASIVLNWPKWPSLNPQNLTKKKSQVKDLLKFKDNNIFWMIFKKSVKNG